MFLIFCRFNFKLICKRSRFLFPRKIPNSGRVGRWGGGRELLPTEMSQQGKEKAGKKTPGTVTPGGYLTRCQGEGFSEPAKWM